jgi:hypothetical protein
VNITAAELTHDMLLDGYRPGAPTAVVAAMDAEIAEMEHDCGTPMIYLPFHAPTGGAYRAYSYCPKCHTAEEF